MKIERIHADYGIEVRGSMAVRLSTLDDARRWCGPAKGITCPACGKPVAECFLNCLDVCGTCGSRLTEGGCYGSFLSYPEPEPDDQPWSTETAVLLPATNQWPSLSRT